ncbi:MAG: YihY/virulence factor BrkB family protein [Cyclobacteriaceae bacterium]
MKKRRQPLFLFYLSATMTKKLNQFRQFIEVDLWRLKLRSLPRARRWGYGFIRVWIIAIKEFIDDKCTEKASALTYFSMLSIVPVVAMLFAIGKGFGIEKLIEQQLSNFLSGQEAVLQQILPLAQNMLGGANSGIITGISMVFLIYTVIKLLMNIEEAFNDMWDIKQSRRWERKISDYVAVILLGPVLLIVASSATVFVTSQIQNFVSEFSILSQLKSGIFFLLKLLPYTLIWLLLTLLYLIFPNTRVRLLPALVAGILAGTLYQLTQWGFINLQFAFSRYNAIYGSLVILPLFLIWLQLSWLIVLFGAEMAYALQYVNEWAMKNEKLKISLSHKKKLMLLLLYRVVKNFENNNGAMGQSELAESVNIPRKYVIDICHELEKSHLITKVDSDAPAYQPSFDIHKMDFHTVLEMYETEGMGDFDNRKSDAFSAIENSLEEIEMKWKETSSNRLLKDL